MSISRQAPDVHWTLQRGLESVLIATQCRRQINGGTSEGHRYWIARTEAVDGPVAVSLTDALACARTMLDKQKTECPAARPCKGFYPHEGVCQDILHTLEGRRVAIAQPSGPQSSNEESRPLLSADSRLGGLAGLLRVLAEEIYVPAHRTDIEEGDLRAEEFKGRADLLLARLEGASRVLADRFLGGLQETYLEETPEETSQHALLCLLLYFGVRLSEDETRSFWQKILGKAIELHAVHGDSAPNWAAQARREALQDLLFTMKMGRQALQVEGASPWAMGLDAVGLAPAILGLVDALIERPVLGNFTEGAGGILALTSASSVEALGSVVDVMRLSAHSERSLLRTFLSVWRGVGILPNVGLGIADFLTEEGSLTNELAAYTAFFFDALGLLESYLEGREKAERKAFGDERAPWGQELPQGEPSSRWGRLKQGFDKDKAVLALRASVLASTFTLYTLSRFVFPKQKGLELSILSINLLAKMTATSRVYREIKERGDARAADKKLLEWLESVTEVVPQSPDSDFPVALRA